MDNKLSLLRLASELAAHSAARQSVIAENVANADTPGYRARDIPGFAEAMAEPSGFAPRATRPGHMIVPDQPRFTPQEATALGAETPNGNSVSLEDQMVRSAELRTNHEMALGVYRKTMDILRDGIGKGPLMDPLAGSMGAAASGMQAQAARLRLSSENIANVDTPGYHRKLVSFEVAAAGGGGAVTTGPIQLDETRPERTYDPAHPLAGADGYYEGSNVNLVVEIADAREANRSYEANLRIFDQARQMTGSLLDLIRR